MITQLTREVYGSFVSSETDVLSKCYQTGTSANIVATVTTKHTCKHSNNGSYNNTRKQGMQQKKQQLMHFVPVHAHVLMKLLW